MTHKTYQNNHYDVLKARIEFVLINHKTNSKFHYFAAYNHLL
ncbi:hypothetical protein [Bartonella jaculi]